MAESLWVCLFFCLIIMTANLSGFSAGSCAVLYLMISARMVGKCSFHRPSIGKVKMVSYAAGLIEFWVNAVAMGV